ncbi:hypothetical protein ABZ957_15465 [Streptomyces sp. NPDC046316]|uniref:hypothetical protein n=1 Tax=Streptomyces sp. NPDC046316 TaxID=3154494 RepID=UPI0033EC9EAD
MTIMTNRINITDAAPIRPEAVIDGVDELVTVAWHTYSETQGLARLGVPTAVSVSAEDKVIVEMTFGAESSHLLPAFVASMKNTALTRTTTGFTIAGTTFHSNVNVKATVGYAVLSVGDAEALVAVVDTDLDDEVAAIDTTDLR